MPSDQIDTLRQYVGGEAPTMHRLGGSDFAKAKSRVRSAVREIAQELVVLYQKRINSTGHAFGPDTPWQHEMEEAFPYVETPDQRVAIDDVRATWSGSTRWTASCAATSGSADRGRDPGAFKRSQEGKQVAVLAPTTLLATHHGKHVRRSLRRLPDPRRGAVAFLTNAQAKR